MKTLLVVNPISGGIDKTNFIKQARRALANSEIEVLETTGNDDCSAIRSKAEKFRPDKLLAVGGDGTFLSSAIATEGMDVVVGIIPMGSSNGMAKELNIPINPSEALELFLAPDKTAKMDAVLINNTHHLLHLGDVGLNAKVIQGFEQDESRGMHVYAKYFFKALTEQEPFEARISSENKILFKGEGVMVAVGNGRRYGTGVQLNQIGNPFDGKFEIVVLTKVTPASFFKKTLSAISDAFSEDENIEHFTVRSAKIELDSPRTLQIDGEVIGKCDVIKAEVKAGFVNVALPEDNPYI
jgi:diacylglycerol kinase family enzyme